MTVCLFSVHIAWKDYSSFIQMRDWFPTWLGRISQSVRLRSFDTTARDCKEGQTRDENSQSINFILYVHSFGVDRTNNKKKTKDRQLQVKRVSKYCFKNGIILYSAYEGHQGEDSIELAFSSTESIIAARRFSEFIAEPASHPIAYVLLHVVVVANRIMQH